MGFCEALIAHSIIDTFIIGCRKPALPLGFTASPHKKYIKGEHL